RFSGTSQIKNGDIIVFDMFDPKMIIVKRCMGVAGDSLKIVNGNVIVNGKLLNPSNKIKDKYKFSINDENKFYKVADSFGLNLNSNKDNIFSGILSVNEKHIFENKNLINSLKIDIDTFSVKFPQSKYIKWT